MHNWFGFFTFCGCIPSLLSAQFVTPLPHPRSAQVVVFDHFRSDYARYRDSVDKAFGDSVVSAVCDSARDCVKTTLATLRYGGGAWHVRQPSVPSGNVQQPSAEAALAKIKEAGTLRAVYADSDTFCQRRDQQERLVALEDLIGSDSITRGDSITKAVTRTICHTALRTGAVLAKNGSWKPRTETESRLPLRFPFSHRRGDIVRYLRDEDKSTLGLLTQFGSGVSDKEAYVLTEIISGLMGRVFFAANVAAVVTRDTAENEQKRKTVEGAKANVLRMINNGGTVTMRFLVPLYAAAGPTFQRASSIYATAGLVGPLGSTDSLKFASTITGEVMTGLAIRDILESATDLGELLVGGRMGYALSESELLPGTGDKGFGYAQLGVGIRAKGKLTLAALVTWPLEHKYKAFGPRKLSLNLSATP